MRLEHSSINYIKQFCISKFDKEKNACSSNGKQSICFFLFYYYYFIIRDEFEFDDLKYSVLIFVLRLTKNTHSIVAEPRAFFLPVRP